MTTDVLFVASLLAGLGALCAAISALHAHRRIDDLKDRADLNDGMIKQHIADHRSVRF